MAKGSAYREVDPVSEKGSQGAAGLGSRSGTTEAKVSPESRVPGKRHHRLVAGPAEQSREQSAKIRSQVDHHGNERITPPGVRKHPGPNTPRFTRFGITAMPYDTNSDLPNSVRDNLPEGAQTIYRKAFNGAWDEYADRDDQEATAHKVAWSAVKQRYEKRDDRWVEKQ
jgi:cation transport regulator